jgi:hypothetical protein
MNAVCMALPSSVGVYTLADNRGKTTFRHQASPDADNWQLTKD